LVPKRLSLVAKRANPHPRVLMSKTTAPAAVRSIDSPAPREAAGGAIYVYPLPFGREAKGKLPFPSDLNYDAKAWETATARHGASRVLFWNVTGPAIEAAYS
jgi:hypothetical protein